MEQELHKLCIALAGLQSSCPCEAQYFNLSHLDGFFESADIDKRVYIAPTISEKVLTSDERKRFGISFSGTAPENAGHYAEMIKQMLDKSRFSVIDLLTGEKIWPKSHSLNPTLQDLERRFNRTGQRPADLFPEGWKLTRFLDLVSDKKKMYLHFSRYGNHKKPRNEKDY